MKKTFDAGAHDEILGAHADWVRGIALALTQDSAAADDLAQDTLRTAVERPPADRRNLRGWLASVMRNRWRDRLRVHRHRAAREKVAATFRDATAPSPDEILERLELEKTVADLVAALPEDLRKIIYLKYFEGCESPEIARRLGWPEGTVRWRLKRALDEIRTRLDEKYRDRRRWAVLLSPLAGAEPSNGLRRSVAGSGPSGSFWMALAVLAGAGVLLWVGAHGSKTTETEVARTLMGSVPPVPGRQNRPPRPPFFNTALAAVDCPSLMDLRRELGIREQEASKHGSFETVFALSPSNSAARTKIGAVLGRAFTRAGNRCAHTVDCRGLVCRVDTLVPEGMDLADCRNYAPEDQWGDRRHAFGGHMSGGLTAEYDPIARKALYRYVDFHRLSSPNGDPVAKADQRQPEPLVPGRHRPLPLPPDLSDACRAEGERLRTEIRRLWSVIDKSPLLEAQQKFASSVRDTVLERDVRKQAQSAIGSMGGPEEVQVECRGRICKFSSTENATVSEAWLNELIRSNRDVFARLEKRKRLPAIARVQGATPRRSHAPTDQGSPFVVIWTEEERARPTAKAIACPFAREVHTAGVLSRCESIHRPSGSLLLLLTFPDPLLPKPDARLAVDARGDLSTTTFGRCLVDGARDIAAGFEVPILRDGGRCLYKLVLPGAASILGDEGKSCGSDLLAP